jgi:hypothetical protein
MASQHQHRPTFMAITNIWETEVLSLQVGNLGTRWRTVVNFMPYTWGKKGPDTHLTGEKMASRANLVTQKRKFLVPACHQDLNSSAVQTRLSHYTEWVTIVYIPSKIKPYTPGLKTSVSNKHHFCATQWSIKDTETW